MKIIYTTILSVAFMLMPFVVVAQVDVDPHTNIPDTHMFVVNELQEFSTLVSRPDISNDRLREALRDLRELLESYRDILERRNQSSSTFRLEADS